MPVTFDVDPTKEPAGRTPVASSIEQHLALVCVHITHTLTTRHLLPHAYIIYSSYLTINEKITYTTIYILPSFTHFTSLHFTTICICMSISFHLVLEAISFSDNDNKRND
jgi:hypothetical protein